MEDYIKLLFVMLIAIIAVAVITQKYEILASLIALGGIYLYMRNQGENLEDEPKQPKPTKVEFVDGPTVDGLNEAENEDSMAQRVVGADVENNDFDNSDIVNQVITGGNNPYQPNWKGNSTTRYQTEPDPNKRNPYQIAMSGKVDADERLAMRQQFTGSLNKRAIDGIVRTQMPMFKRMFQDELEQNETREWWTAEANPMESNMDVFS